MGPGYRFAERYLSRAAMLRATAGKGDDARDTFRNILRSGKIQAILRIQVFLRNNGFDEVKIDGKPSAALDMALDQCLRNKDCVSGLGQPI
jgi:hypothetical protein